MREEDPAYVDEKRRQQEQGMRPCLCSNCRPDLVPLFFEQQPHLTTKNFDSWMTATSIRASPVTNGWKTPILQPIKSTGGSILSCAANEVIWKNPLLCSLAEDLSVSFLALYNETFPNNNCYVRPHHMLTEVSTWKIIKNFALLRSGVSLRAIFGSEPITGTFKIIQDCLNRWASKDNFRLYLVEAADRVAKAAVSSTKRAENKKKHSAETTPKINPDSQKNQRAAGFTQMNVVTPGPPNKRHCLHNPLSSQTSPHKTTFRTTGLNENYYQYPYNTPTSAGPYATPTRFAEPLRNTTVIGSIRPLRQLCQTYIQQTT